MSENEKVENELPQYVLRENVRAEKVEEDGPAFTNAGVLHANKGDYLVHKNNGVTLVDGELFESTYVPREYDGGTEEDEENERDGTVVEDEGPYDPRDYTVTDVLQYMRDNRDDVDRVKDLERQASHPRSTILNF